MNIFRFVIRFGLVISIANPVFAQSHKKIKFRHYKPDDIVYLSQFKTTHALAKAYLKLKQQKPEVAQVAKRMLENKPILVKNLKIKNKTLYFTWKSKQHRMTFIKDGKYKIDNEVIDFNSMKLGVPDTTAGLADLFISPSHAAIPLMVWYFGIIITTVALASGCLAINISSYADTGITAKFISNSALNRKLRQIRQELGIPSGGCAANANSLVDDNIDYAGILQKACELRKSDQDPFEQLTQNPEFMFNVCQGEDCSQNSTQVSFMQLDELNQDIIRNFVQNDEFMQSYCNQNSDLPSGSSSGSDNSQGVE